VVETQKKIEPAREYASRLQALSVTEAHLRRQDRLFVGVKLAAGLVALVLVVWLAKYHSSQIAYALIPIAILILLFVWHERLLRQLHCTRRLHAFYEKGIARIESRWAGTGQSGEQFLDPAHPYARDLDLFGKGGLFELLCTARTRAGEATLAAWLLSHAAIEEIRQRQQAVQELAPQLDFRERLMLAGEGVRSGVHPEALMEWAESKTRLEPHKLLRIVLPLLAACWVASLLAWLLWDWGLAALLISMVNLALTYRLRARAESSLSTVDEASHDLDLLAAVLKEIEAMPFHSPKLVNLQLGLRSGKSYSSHAIRRLNKRVTWLDAHENWFVKVLDLFVFWTPQWLLAVEAWRELHAHDVRRWIETTGEIEALTALGCYRYEHPEDTFPEFAETGPLLRAEGMAHPLLPRGKAVSNDLQLDVDLQLLVISGPNMAGKSTFIRCVGINVVLAQAGAPVCARHLMLSPLTVAASICILDSLQGGLSRFYAEILRLKTIEALSKAEAPLLFLLDELLSGTNSHDRRVGTESFVRHLLSRGAIGLITTHDLALAKIAESLPGKAANYHFSDEVEDGELRFDYKLTPGVVQTTNALELMRSIGLPI